MKTVGTLVFYVCCWEWWVDAKDYYLAWNGLGSTEFTKVWLVSLESLNRLVCRVKVVVIQRHFQWRSHIIPPPGVGRSSDWQLSCRPNSWVLRLDSKKFVSSRGGIIFAHQHGYVSWEGKFCDLDYRLGIHDLLTLELIVMGAHSITPCGLMTKEFVRLFSHHI